MAVSSERLRLWAYYRLLILFWVDLMRGKLFNQQQKLKKKKKLSSAFTRGPPKFNSRTVTARVVISAILKQLNLKNLNL